MLKCKAPQFICKVCANLTSLSAIRGHWFPRRWPEMYFNLRGTNEQPRQDVLFCFLCVFFLTWFIWAHYLYTKHQFETFPLERILSAESNCLIFQPINCYFRGHPEYNHCLHYNFFSKKFWPTKPPKVSLCKQKQNMWKNTPYTSKDEVMPQNEEDISDQCSHSLGVFNGFSWLAAWNFIIEQEEIVCHFTIGSQGHLLKQGW